MNTLLDKQRGFVEYLVGRQLRHSEHVIDVLKIDDALNTAKDEIEAAIRREMVAAVERGLLFRMPVQINLTPEILTPLENLFRLGLREAFRELQRLGYPSRRHYVAEPQYPELDPLAHKVKAGLRGLGVRVEQDITELDLGDGSRGAIAQALLNVPGARFIAAEVISRAFTTGLQQTFEANQDLIAGWEYTSVLDGTTCDPCSELDGTTYANLDELFTDLPGFGPSVVCLGGDRCRCRAVPLGPNG